MSKVLVTGIATPSAPAAGKTLLYAKADGKMYSLGNDGVERGLTSPGTFAAASVLANFRNRLINGDAIINQRGMVIGSGAGTTVAHNSYCLDRWYVQAETANSANATVSQLTDPASDMANCIRLVQPDATAKRMGVVQVIEGVNIRGLKSSGVTLSGKLRSTLAQTIRYAVFDNTGTENTWSHNMVNTWSSTTWTASNFFVAGRTPLATGSTTLTANTWTAFSLNATVSADPKNLVVMIWTEGTFAQTNSLDIGLVQLEPGSTATAFEYRHYGFELDLCQRYFNSTFGPGVAPAANTDTANALSSWCGYTYSTSNYYYGPDMEWTYPTAMRIVPTITTYNPTLAGNSGFGYSGSNYAIATSYIGTGRTRWQSARSTSNGPNGALILLHAIADADF